jgi:hypothetical protein
MDDAGRTRFIHQWWDRDPEGIILDKFKPPLGKRCPNGNVWGHTTDDLFMTERIPGVGVVTCYSRSMIKELNERPIDPDTEPATPRLRRPYPLLELDPGVECEESFRLGFLDEGSDHGDPVPFEIEDVAQQLSTTPRPAEDPGNDDKNESSTNISSAQDSRVDTDSKKSNNNNPIHMKLEEFIPKEFLPDTLLVHDPRVLVYGTDGEGYSEKPFRPQFIYERRYPDFSDKDKWVGRKDEKREAHLYLNRNEPLGVGHHSNIYRATLALPEGLSARTHTGRVTVAAKIAFNRTEARSLLANEGKIYDAMPRHMSEEWCGLNMVPPLTWPVPVGPIVPKFYGFYTPTTANRNTKESLSPILLMEECGTPVDPRNLSAEQRSVPQLSNKVL